MFAFHKNYENSATNSAFPTPAVTSATLAFAEEFMHYVRLDLEAPEVLRPLSRKCKLGLVFKL